MIQLSLVLMGLFAAIGIYWAVRAENFLEWTTGISVKLRKAAGQGLSQPVLVERTYANYYRLEKDGIMGTFAWSLRFLGIVMAFFAIFVSSFIISSFI